MCGHVGVAGHLTKKEEDVFKQLLIVDSLRGTDSTGVAVIPSFQPVKVVKDIGNPYELMDRKSFDKALLGLNRAIIGHNRYATVGGVDKNTAHPFEFDTLVGAHNGTLTNKWNFDNHSDFAVDSQALFNQINKTGLKDAMSKATGAWCIIWWDKVNESINFLRNKERPLWMVRTSDGKTLFWASELWMLEGVLARNNIAFEDPHFLDHDLHMSIEINSKGEMSKPRVSAITGKPEYQYKGYTHGHPFVPDNKEEKKTAVVLPLNNQKKEVDYSPDGHVSLEIIAQGSDKFGSRYFTCVDWSCPEAELRLYFTRLPFAPDDAIGGTIVAVVNKGKSQIGGTTFYKVVASSVNWDDLDHDEPVKEAYDHHNNVITPIQFKEKYGECAWCSGVVSHDEKHVLTTEGQSLCKDCCEDTELRKYFTIVGSVRNKG